MWRSLRIMAHDQCWIRKWRRPDGEGNHPSRSKPGPNQGLQNRSMSMILSLQYSVLMLNLIPHCRPADSGNRSGPCCIHQPLLLLCSLTSSQYAHNPDFSKRASNVFCTVYCNAHSIP
ncbi:hypothetical protein BDV18DRAFT_147643 [Aspergillus unguis]